MYLQKVIIRNIRSITDLEMEFPNPAGWHVLIGDNGSGKSTIIRAIAATLIGPEQIGAILPVWNEWLRQNTNEGLIELKILPDKNHDKRGRGQPSKGKQITNEFTLQRTEKGHILLKTNIMDPKLSPSNHNWSVNSGWFSVAYGPFRRFTGGNDKWNKVFFSAPKAGAHLSVFGEDIALTEALDWIKELDHRRLKDKEETDSAEFGEMRLFNCIKKVVSDMNLLPNGVRFEKVDRYGNLIFKEGNGTSVNIKDMSDGFRSILSLTLELIRQLILAYSVESVFPKGAETQSAIQISLPGVVLIDEIDVHLHPTWQTKIGKWFTKFFPNIQFIVATHSPLVCRACGQTGSVWRLANVDNEIFAENIEGIDRERLIHGNILDAYGTELFGDDVSIDEETATDRNRLGELYEKSIMGLIQPVEKTEFQRLKALYPTFNFEMPAK